MHNANNWCVKPLITLERVADIVPSGATLFVGGSGGGLQEPSALISTLGQAFKQKGAPCDLTLWHCSGIGDKAGGGLSHFATPGNLRRVIGGHWGMSPELADLAVAEEIDAYNFPQGVIAHLLRVTGSGEDGLLTKVGLRTFVDPRVEGGRLNARTTEELVQLVTVRDREYLFYPAPRIDVCLLRATSADVQGNLSFEDEAAILEPLEAALATKRNGGIVIVQVSKYLAKNSINPRDVRVPGNLVDYLVHVKECSQTAVTHFEPGFTGKYRVPLESLPIMPVGLRRIVAELAYREIAHGQLVNLGVGMPDGIAKLASERNEIDQIAFAVEQGHIGGIPAGGIEFGAVFNPSCSLPAASQFDLFDGGHLDVAFLGMAEVDQYGNVNVSRHGGGISGAGGFINITQGTHKVVFCGSFTAGGLAVDVGANGLAITTEGRFGKFVDQVKQITFSGARARELKQEVLYVTERAVFRLIDEGLELIEVVEGVDIERDIVAQMSFRPVINEVAVIRLPDHDVTATERAP
ncbi:acyl CoA:acetate/3-ketoacid CoA transferase [Halomonas dongshanensis]|uniref:Acetate CoA-transferase YdiF n=1 Tax=Halomonas dongshanensis TaxID=2890835 RepID=A0ABT2EAX8_9GAMM|nr:CoA-transferase [Halomonas dongshanensis]MCS2608725.1 acyl CoA:acetate/3-ketoacid CoA transferase [Halomonas dongshanensis]